MKELLKNPVLLRPTEHIFLMSHMRANTSLFGHILGSSNEINGYYEMHTGYYSWKSLLKQKLMFHEVHQNSELTKYYFDKILHSYHAFENKVFEKKNVKIIFMLRAPERTIKSICYLYREVEPEHKHATVQGAVDYYIERLLYLKELALKIGGSDRCLYIDAECLVSNSEVVLHELSSWLNLKTSLSSEFKNFKLTNKEYYGDPSGRLKEGKISKNSRDYKDIVLDKEIIKYCEIIYNETRDQIMKICRNVNLEHCKND